MARIAAYDPTISIGVPQGPGSGFNSDQVDGYNASSNPAPNQLIPLGPDSTFPVEVIPTSGGGGSGFLLGNGAPTDRNILIADGTLWQSRTMSGDATISADTGTLTLASSGVVAGSYGLEDTVPQITFDAKGRATSATNVPILIEADQIQDASGVISSLTTYTSSAISPQDIAFDGVNMWTANGSGGVSKITPSGTFTTYNSGVFASAAGIAFDGTNMWVCDNSNQIVVKVSPSGVLTSYSTAPNAGVAIAFDGVNMWMSGADASTGIVAKISPTGIVTAYSTGVGTKARQRIAFDGTNMWATSYVDTNLTKISPAGTITLYSLTGVGPYGVAFDGTALWLCFLGDGSVSKVSLAGSETNYNLGLAGPERITFDGTNMWTANTGDDSVSVITPGGSETNYSPTGSQPCGIAKKTSTEMWTANIGNASVTKVVLSSAILGIVNAQIDPTAQIDVTKFKFPLLGDLNYGGTAGASTVLPGNTTSTKKFLTQTGTGSLSTAPGWNTIVAGDVPTLNQNTSGTASNITASSNTSLTSLVNLVTVGTLSSLVMGGTIKVFGDTTGSGTVIGLGTNCPASSLTAPYTWVKVLSSDGSTVWMPGFK